MMKSAWLGGLLALGIVACGDDSGGSGGGSSSTGDATTTTSAGTPTSSSGGTPTSSSSGSSPTSSGSGGDPTGGGGDPTGGGGDPTGGGGDPTGGGGDPTGGGGGGGNPGAAAEIVDCNAVEVDVEVGTNGGAYTPTADISLFVGEVLRFDPGGGAHDFDSDDGSWADTPLSQEVCLQFNLPGEYTAFCSIHLFEATVTVSE